MRKIVVAFCLFICMSLCVNASEAADKALAKFKEKVKSLNETKADELEKFIKENMPNVLKLIQSEGGEQAEYFYDQMISVLLEYKMLKVKNPDKAKELLDSLKAEDNMSGEGGEGGYDGGDEGEEEGDEGYDEGGEEEEGIKKGEQAPDIELTTIKDGSKFKLSSLKGKVVYIDFWATWCGPCQEPMAELNKIAKNQPSNWAGKVVLLGASIDDKMAIIKKHINKKKWTDLHQCWCGEGGWSAAAAKAFKINGVPTAYLIGKDGKVVWSGFPNSKVVEKINAELAK